MADVRAAVALQRLFHHRRKELGAALVTASTKSAATVVSAHIDELNVIHDQLADAGVMPPRTGRHDELIAPYDPIGRLPVPDFAANPRRTPS